MSLGMTRTSEFGTSLRWSVVGFRRVADVGRGHPLAKTRLTSTRAGGFVLTRQEAAGKWGAATYSLVRTSKA
jgi:hypothetical protein